MNAVLQEVSRSSMSPLVVHGLAHRYEGGQVLTGAKKPWDCKVFGTACTPEMPLGACMVSSEGACAAYYNYAHIRVRKPSRRPVP